MSVAHQPLDTQKRFVRVSGQRPNGFVEFEFAIGEPEIFVEMILDREAFANFCATQGAEILPPRDADAVVGDWDWRMSNAAQTRFR